MRAILEENRWASEMCDGFTLLRFDEVRVHLGQMHRSGYE